ncbi:MAG: hypothetical protein ACLGIG_06460 [Actinomycetes bacterium]
MAPLLRDRGGAAPGATEAELPAVTRAADHSPRTDGRRITLALDRAQVQHLPHWVPRLVADGDPGPGDAVTVDLGRHPSVHLPGLGLLLMVLWRRVGPHGDVTVRGGTSALQATLASLGITARDCRAAVYGAAGLTPPRG